MTDTISTWHFYEDTSTTYIYGGITLEKLANSIFYNNNYVWCLFFLQNSEQALLKAYPVAIYSVVVKSWTLQPD